MVSLLATAAQGFAAHCAGHETRCINSRTEGLLDREVLTMPTREMLVHLRNRTLARLQLQPNSTVNYEWMMRTYRQGMHWSKQGLTPGYWAGASPTEGQEDAGGCLYGHTSLEQAANGHECVADPVPPCGGKTACGWCGRHVSVHVCTCLSQPAARAAASAQPVPAFELAAALLLALVPLVQLLGRFAAVRCPRWRSLRAPPSAHCCSTRWSLVCPAPSLRAPFVLAPWLALALAVWYLADTVAEHSAIRAAPQAAPALRHRSLRHRSLLRPPAFTTFTTLPTVTSTTPRPASSPGRVLPRVRPQVLVEHAQLWRAVGPPHRPRHLQVISSDLVRSRLGLA